MDKLVKEYIESIKKVRKLGREIIKRIIDIVEEEIPRVNNVVGWSGADEVLYFYRQKKFYGKRKNKERVRFEDIIQKIFPELVIDDIDGIFLTEEEGRKLEERLKKLKNNKNKKEG